METTLEQELEEAEARPLSDTLNITDRCDQCGAQAFVWVNMPNSQAGLLYCNHHYQKNKEGLREVAIDIVDESYKINKKASASSPD
jgi:hypothetical protein